MDNGNGTGMIMPVGPAYSGMGNSGWGNNFGSDGW